ncbi:MAG: glycosyltransferase family 2 protein [Cyanobacteria bacterium P01_A01_bin.45]
MVYFSVIITTHNRLKLLKRAIDSVLDQTIECELIVVDDFSDDGTSEYLENLSVKLYARNNFRLIYIRNASNQGHSTSVNVGVAAAIGDWIKFLDDDDYLAPDCLEEMGKAIALRPEAAICSCIAAQVDSNQVELSRTPVIGPGTAFYIPQADVHYGMLLEQVPFGTPAQVACRRTAFLETGGWKSALDTNCDDIDSWIDTVKFGDAIFINKCLAYRTIWLGAFNQRFSLTKRLNTNILMKQKIYTLVDKQHNCYMPKFDDIKNYLRLHWLLIAIRHQNLLEIKNIFDFCIFSPKVLLILVNAFLLKRLGVNSYRVRKNILIN